MHAIQSLILMICLIGLVFAENSPVFLWGAHSVAKPSLTTISSDEFINIVTPLLANKALVIFLENDLSSKDFLCTNIADGNSCYARLQEVGDKTYYASVEDPVETLRGINGEHLFSSVDASGKLSKPLEMGAGKISFVKFDDGNQHVARESILKSHDSIIASIISQLGDNVFFMYVSSPTPSPLTRQRRQTSDNSDGFVIRDGANLLLYFKSLSIIEGKTKTTFEMVKDQCLPPNQCVESYNATAMSVTLKPKTGFPLTFDINLDGGYFFLRNVVYNNYKFVSSEVYAPTDFSYFCGNLVLNNIRVDTEKVPAVVLQWNSLQFQAPFGLNKNATFVFSDPWHCVGFFTGGILSGLLIVALLLTITFIGICWMMDINTMDRFDDPKGKTITISATE